jgi:hypothetical protein
MDVLIVLGMLALMTAIIVLPILYFRNIKGSRSSGLRGAFEVAQQIYQPGSHAIQVVDEHKTEAGREDVGTAQPQRKGPRQGKPRIGP